MKAMFLMPIMVLLTLLLIMWLEGCSSTKIARTNRPFDFVEMEFSSLPDWKKDDFNKAGEALARSCQAPNEIWKGFCDGFKKQKTAKEIRKYIEKTLTPYLVTSYGKTSGTFTGYYETELTGTLKQTHSNQTPIYGIPNDLIKVYSSDVCRDKSDDVFYGRAENGRFVSYFDRKNIMKNGCNAPVLLWADCDIDAFILHIQGSGRVITPDGVYRIGYAGNNGHPFVGIGKIMSDEGLLKKGKASMPEIKKWLKKNPKKAKELMAQNPRYIFFDLKEDMGGPIGAAGVPLTAERSLAVDTNYIPLSTPIYLTTSEPKIRKLVVAQDKGSAIKGPIRGDYFWGYGDEAFEKAGRMKSSGSYYILWPKGRRPLQ